MSKQSSFERYFRKRKGNNDADRLAKRCRIENENIITQSNTVANEPCDFTSNNTTTDIQSIEDHSVTSKAAALLVVGSSAIILNNHYVQHP